MSTLMTAVGTVVTAAIGWMGQFADAIASNTILTLGVVAVTTVPTAVINVLIVISSLILSYEAAAKASRHQDQPTEQQQHRGSK